MMLSNNLTSVLARAQAGQGDHAIGLTRKLTGRNAPVESQADKAAKDFESMFVSQMLENMFGESLGDDLFGSSDTDEVYKSLMMQEYGKQIVASGGMGIASYVKRELLKLQEV